MNSQNFQFFDIFQPYGCRFQFPRFTVNDTKLVENKLFARNSLNYVLILKSEKTQKTENEFNRSILLQLHPEGLVISYFLSTRFYSGNSYEYKDLISNKTEQRLMLFKIAAPEALKAHARPKSMRNVQKWGLIGMKTLRNRDMGKFTFGENRANFGDFQAKKRLYGDLLVVHKGLCVLRYIKCEIYSTECEIIENHDFEGKPVRLISDASEISSEDSLAYLVLKVATETSENSSKLRILVLKKSENFEPNGEFYEVQDTSEEPREVIDAIYFEEEWLGVTKKAIFRLKLELPKKGQKMRFLSVGDVYYDFEDQIQSLDITKAAIMINLNNQSKIENLTKKAISEVDQVIDKPQRAQKRPLVANNGLESSKVAENQNFENSKISGKTAQKCDYSVFITTNGSVYYTKPLPDAYSYFEWNHFIVFSFDLSGVILFHPPSIPTPHVVNAPQTTPTHPTNSTPTTQTSQKSPNRPKSQNSKILKNEEKITQKEEKPQKTIFKYTSFDLSTQHNTSLTPLLISPIPLGDSFNTINILAYFSNPALKSTLYVQQLKLEGLELNCGSSSPETLDTKSINFSVHYLSTSTFNRPLSTSYNIFFENISNAASHYLLFALILILVSLTSLVLFIIKKIKKVRLQESSYRYELLKYNAKIEGKSPQESPIRESGDCSEQVIAVIRKTSEEMAAEEGDGVYSLADSNGPYFQRMIHQMDGRLRDLKRAKMERLRWQNLEDYYTYEKNAEE